MGGAPVVVGATTGAVPRVLLPEDIGCWWRGTKHDLREVEFGGARAIVLKDRVVEDEPAFLVLVAKDREGIRWSPPIGTDDGAIRIAWAALKGRMVYDGERDGDDRPVWRRIVP